MKLGIICISIILGFIAELGIINKYWLPESIRPYFVYSKFERGDCLSMPRMWGNRIKLVLNYKETKSKTGYLLQDRDKYEHLNYISKVVVERYAQKVNCPRS